MHTLKQLKEQNIPTTREVDILIVGGGTAGAVAGIAAGREEMNALVIEQQGFLGGTQTGALVTPMMPNQLSGAPLNGGIDLEINTGMIALRESGVWKDGNQGWFNPEMLKLMLERMNLQAGTELLYYTFFEDAILEKSDLCGVVIANKAGRSAILAKRIIDCTGDADVAFRAGVPFESGDPETKKNQLFSVRFHLGNVDLSRFAEFLTSLGRSDVLESAQGSNVPLIHTAMVWGKGWTLEPLFREAIAEGILKESDGNYFQIFSMAGRPGELAFNCPRISQDIDGTNPFHLTAAQIKGREITQRYVSFCQRYLPGLERAYLITTAPMVGVRESRRIQGEYFLTVNDVLGAKKFPDAICRNNYPLDIHRDKKDDHLKFVKLPHGEYHEVPYRCLIPLSVDQLLVAGRCFSGSFEAQSSVRIQTNCRAMGEAAAVASAISIRASVPPRKVDGVELRKILIEKGASL
ncbi:MAG: FAD-dependent oxidoreductase [bacterium]